VRRLAFACIALQFLCLTPVNAQQPDWQIHSLWCTTDGGSSGRNYRNACTQVDQYDSILSCQSHSNSAQAAIRAAGRSAVDSFMESRKLGFCKSSSAPPPAPAQADYYVIWRYSCQYADRSSAGDCTINQHSHVSCQDAQRAIQQRAQSQDVCKQCTNNIRDDSKHVVGGPQRITGGGPCSGQ
jgi:hypothetical protein